LLIGGPPTLAEMGEVGNAMSDLEDRGGAPSRPHGSSPLLADESAESPNPVTGEYTSPSGCPACKVTLCGVWGGVSLGRSYHSVEV